MFICSFGELIENKDANIALALLRIVFFVYESVTKKCNVLKNQH